MRYVRTTIIRLTLTLTAFILFSGCQPQQSTSSSLRELPPLALLTLSTADSCISVLNADTQVLAGEIRNPDFHKAYSFNLSENGNLFLPLSGEYTQSFKEVLVLDLFTNKELAKITTPESPYLLSIGSGQYGFITHNVIYPNNQTEASAIDAVRHTLLYQIKLDGIANDVLVSGNFAYIAIEALTPNQPQGLLIYDITTRSEIQFFEMADRPMSITLSKYFPDRVYVALHQPQVGDSYCDAEPSDIIQVDTKTGEQQVIGRVVLPTDLVEVDENHLLISESCFGRGKHIRLLDITKQEVVREVAIGTDPSTIVKLSDELVAISVKEDMEVAFVRLPDLEVVSRVSVNCKWPLNMVLWDKEHRTK